MQFDINIYPNPFNNDCRIYFKLSKNDLVYIGIYDLKGFKIIQLINQNKIGGYHNTIMNGKNIFGQLVSDGIYFCVFRVNYF